MQVQHANDVRIYNVSSGRALPDWLSERKRRKLLQQDEGLRRRIELLQDFTMPTASLQMKVSRDGNYILTTGVYQPRIRCFDVTQLGMKFERYLTCETVAFEPISDGYEKMVFLHADRSIELHAKYGTHYKTRIPKFGRALAYHRQNCDLYCVGASSEVYRLNLEQGRFMESYKTKSSALNAVAIDALYDLIFVGGADGQVEAWDPRAPVCASSVDVAAAVVSAQGTSEAQLLAEISALQITSNGLSLGVGTSTGHCLLYDIRSKKPLIVKDHMYGLPVHSIHFHSSGKVISADKKIVRVWDGATGNNFTSIEPDVDINGMAICPTQTGSAVLSGASSDSGLIMLALEQPKMGSYFIPELGQAPRWSMFLENLTEELEETSQAEVYDDYKFVTERELHDLGLAHLIGTNMLRAYMHGYFMDVRLYHKAKSIADPFAYDEYRKKRIDEKVEKQRESRIRIKTKLPKVNPDFAKTLLMKATEKRSKQLASGHLSEEEVDDESMGQAIAELTKDGNEDRFANPLNDSRFASMFANPEFSIDRESEEFRLLHPIAQQNRSTKQSQLQQIFEPVDEEEDEDEEPEGRPEDESTDDDLAEEESRKKKNPWPERRIENAKRKKARMFTLKADEELKNSLRKQQTNQPLGRRLQSGEADVTVNTTRTPTGGMEYKFNWNAPKRGGSKGGARDREQKESTRTTGGAGADKSQRRGVRDLRLSNPDKAAVFWRGQKVNKK